MTGKKDMKIENIFLETKHCNTINICLVKRMNRFDLKQHSEGVKNIYILRT